jgi:mRNA interferase RelE/StbE
VADYRLLIKPSAVKEIEAIDSKAVRRRIVDRIWSLAHEQRPSGCEKLAGPGGLYRVRQGSYRVVCAIDDAARMVEVIKVGHRREVYRAPR